MEGVVMAGDICLWIQKHADIKFKWPVDVSRLGYPKENKTAEAKAPEGETP
jgi:hypothetical protein